MKLKVGDTAPGFSLPSSSGTEVKLSDYRGKKKVVLYFYPEDDTPGCTREACTFRDKIQSFKKSDAEVFGVSFDGKESHEKFIEKFSLPFTLLSDEKKEVGALYDAIKETGLKAKRVTFVIDREGKIRHIAENISPEMHVNEALSIVRSL